MGRRGPPSKHPSGVGHTTKKGYHRLDIGGGRQRLAHNVEWERHNGPIPRGFLIHHIDEDKQNNRIENLQLVDTVTHKRIHSGCELRDGVWWKPCSVCREFKPIDREHWYISPEGWPLYGRCRICHCRIVTDKERQRGWRKKRKKPEMSGLREVGDDPSA